MKKVLSFLMCAILTLSLAACGPVATERSAELHSQYTYYNYNASMLRNDMGVTPEQADEIFLALVAAGSDKSFAVKPQKKTGQEGVFVVDSVYEVTLKNGAVEKITKSGKAVYPESLVKEEQRAAEAAEAAEAESTRQAKDVAVLMDSQLIEVAKNSQEVIVLLQEGIGGLTESTESVLMLYSLADTAEQSQSSLLSSVGSVRDKDNKEYVGAIQEYIVNGQIICKKLKEYLDGGSLENLTDIQTRLTASQSYYEKVDSARREYLSNQGFSDDEITNIISK